MLCCRSVFLPNCVKNYNLCLCRFLALFAGFKRFFHCSGKNTFAVAKPQPWQAMSRYCQRPICLSSVCYDRGLRSNGARKTYYETGMGSPYRTFRLHKKIGPLITLKGSFRGHESGNECSVLMVAPRPNVHMGKRQSVHRCPLGNSSS